MIEAQLTAGLPILDPVAVVAAHPDDETLGLGSRLARFERLKLIHLTDGAPRDLADAGRAGFTSASEYAAARRSELHAALMTLSSEPSSLLALDCPDKEAVDHLVSLTWRLVEDLRDAQHVITHAYENGHPDHDAAAFVVHAACALLRRERKRVPTILEFPAYHLRGGQVVHGRFWPDPLHREWVVKLTSSECSQKARAVACFLTQRAVLEPFALDEESYRRAPAYDFSQAAPPGAALYDLFGWHVTSAVWRRQATEALSTLGLGGAL